jgi:aldehyde dehydrogenase (NAD+)
MGAIVGDCEHALANLEKWAAPHVANNDLGAMDFQSSYVVTPTPKGVTLNIAPWNFPVILSLTPLVPALAAGNCMIIKPSEMTPHCAEVIEYLVNNYLDTDCVKIVQGAVAETTALLAQRWDHIFYTGNGAVARIVMQAAAKNLTPCTLELGGKSPVLVDKTADMTAVVNRVFWAKSTNCGQICVAPDFVVIDETRSEEFLREFTKQVHASGFANGSKQNANWGNIINARHAERLVRLIETSGGEVVCGGAEQADAAARHVPFTVIKNPDPSAPIMHEEIFGPILPVISVKNMDEAIQMVKDREHPLGLYIFSKDKSFQQQALRECDSGGAAVNTCAEQLLNKEAPFGGIGASGMGQYHGKAGFDEFSHPRTVLFKSGQQGVLPPPEQQPEWLYDVALKFFVTGFISPETKQKMKLAAASAVAFGGAVALRSRL